jgi:hypothetical protein
VTSLVAIKAYDLAEPACAFFSWLAGRPPAPRHALPTLPVEVVDEILGHLLMDLLEVARLDLVREVGPCDCSGPDEMNRHQCGMAEVSKWPCTSWISCCFDISELNEDEPDDERMGRFEQMLHTVWIPRVCRAS